MRYAYEWFNELEMRGAAVDSNVAGYGYISPGLTWFTEWNAVTPLWATAAKDPIKNFNRIKANITTIRDLFGWSFAVAAQFTPTTSTPGERITRAKLEQLADVIEAAENAMYLFDTQGPWIGKIVCGSGLTL